MYFVCKDDYRNTSEHHLHLRPALRECANNLYLAAYALFQPAFVVEGDRPDKACLTAVHQSVSLWGGESVECLLPQTRRNVGIFLLHWFTPFSLPSLFSALFSLFFFLHLPSYSSPALPPPSSLFLLSNKFIHFLTALIYSAIAGLRLCYRCHSPTEQLPRTGTYCITVYVSNGAWLLAENLQ